MSFIKNRHIRKSSVHHDVHTLLVVNSDSYIGALIRLWLSLFPIFLFAAKPKEFFLDGLTKLEQQSHKCVELRGEYVE
jgi:hypothetical protein